MSPILWMLGLVVLTAAAGFAAVRYALVFPLVDRPRNDADGAGPAVSGADPARIENRIARLERHLTATASVPHNTRHLAALEHAADYIVETLRDLGYTVTFQEYAAEDGIVVRNIATRIEPVRIDEPDGIETLVIGAHYDSADDSPGANDNASGVAALLELARELVDHRPERHRLRLVFFVNEEAPYCKTPDMGSWRFAEMLKRRKEEHVTGMIALETLGYFSSEPGSQMLPFPFNRIYDDRGDYVAFVGLPRARRLTHAATRAFRQTRAFPSIGGIAPPFVDGIDLSDHWAFDQFAIPALMITDTAPFRNPFYHRLDDTPDKVDCRSLAAIVDGLVGMVEGLAPARPAVPRLKPPGARDAALSLPSRPAATPRPQAAPPAN